MKRIYTVLSAQMLCFCIFAGLYRTAPNAMTEPEMGIALLSSLLCVILGSLGFYWVKNFHAPKWLYIAFSALFLAPIIIVGASPLI